MSFNILEFLWYLIKLLGFAALTLFLMSICVAIINVMIDSFKKRKMQENLDKALLEAVKSGNINVDVIEKKQNNKK